jgi:hypothetical protein
MEPSFNMDGLVEDDEDEVAVSEEDWEPRSVENLHVPKTSVSFSCD